MDDDTETVDEPADEVEVVPDAPEPEPEPEPEPVAEPEPEPEQSVEVAGGQPEPTPVGHAIVQDNTTPGVQRTMTADGVETSSTAS